MSDTNIKRCGEREVRTSCSASYDWRKRLLRGHGIGRLELRSNHVKSL